jgi:hypothetical protein
MYNRKGKDKKRFEGGFVMATTNTKTTVKTAEAEVKKTATKTTPVKTESKPAAKAVETKTKAAKKTTVAKTTRKPAAKKGTEVKADVFVQFGGKEFSEEAIMSKVVAAWEAEGKKASAIKRAKLYIKPEDGKAYYVINEGLKNGSTGAVNL